MLVWLTLPFYDFCVFRSVAVNTVYNLQFFTFIYLSTVANELPIEFMNIVFRKFSMCLSVTDNFYFAFKLQWFNLCLQFNYQLCSLHNSWLWNGVCLIHFLSEHSTHGI